MLWYGFDLHNISVYWFCDEEQSIYNGVPVPSLMEFEFGCHDGDMENMAELNAMLDHNNQLWRQRRQDWIQKN